jgi:hypothetical protein
VYPSRQNKVGACVMDSTLVVTIVALVLVSVVAIVLVSYGLCKYMIRKKNKSSRLSALPASN